MASSKTNHRWKFFRAGTVDQVVLADGDDLSDLATLDKKLWVALACPTRGLEIDARSLDLVDTDADGRIRPPEILGAIAWMQQVLRNLNDLFAGGDELPLASIRTDTDAGRDLQGAATRVLSAAGRPEATKIGLAEVTEVQSTFVHAPLNGDGVVTVESATDDDTRSAIGDAIAAAGSVVDRSGKPGIDDTRLTAFSTRLAAYSTWLDGGNAAAVLGESTSSSFARLTAVRAKIDDYFVRCRLSAFDARARDALAASAERLAELSARVLTPEDDAIASLPLAPVDARGLPIRGTNPAWSARLAEFEEHVARPVLGSPREFLAESDWTAIKRAFAPHDAWLAARPDDGALEKLGADRVRALARGRVLEEIAALIAKDAALAGESAQIEAVEKAIRLRRDLLPLLRNFVNFADFYGARRGAFQAGTLYLDGRSCDLCLPVHDVAKHASLAGLSNAYLAYCDCTRKKDAEKRTIVAAVTGGGVDNLMVGRNGVFYDRKGDDWDATVTKVVENPISIRQAFWAPYKRFVRLIEEQVAKRAAAADTEANKRLDEGVKATTSAVDGKPPAAAPPPPAEKKIDVGTVAAIGVAVGGIATFFSSILATVLGLGMWMPLGLVALILAISGPSMLIAWLKLRHRNIGPLLDANGWAVNAFARVNLPFGEALTSLATLPRGASRALRDPFAEKRQPWGFYLFVLLVIIVGAVWALGKIDAYLPDSIKSTTVLHLAPGASSTVAPAPEPSR